MLARDVGGSASDSFWNHVLNWCARLCIGYGRLGSLDPRCVLCLSVSVSNMCPAVVACYHAWTMASMACEVLGIKLVSADEVVMSDHDHD